MVATEPVATNTFRSPFPDIEIPEVPLTAFVFARAQELGNKPALIDAQSGRRMTYARLVDSVHRAAFGLHRRGFAKGSRRFPARPSSRRARCSTNSAPGGTGSPSI